MNTIKLLVVLAVLGFSSVVSAQQTPFWHSLSAEEKEYMPQSENCFGVGMVDQMAEDSGRKLPKRVVEVSKKCRAMCKRLKAVNDPNAERCPKK